MNKYLQILIASGIVLLGSWGFSSAASTFIVQQGGTGVNTFTPSQLIYGNGTNALSSTATTSVICSGSASCTPFTAIGGSPITISASSGSGDPFIHPIANSSATTSRMLIGTTTFPTGSTYNDQLDISTSTNDFVAVGNWNLSNGACASAEFDANNNISTLSTNYASFGITGGSFTGIGCANNPFTAFGANSAYSIVTNGNMNWAMGSTSSSAQFRWLTDTNGDGQYTTADTKMILTQAGKLAIGSTTPDAPLTITNDLTSFALPPSGTTIHFVQSGTNARAVGDTYFTGQTGTNYQGRHARGTSALPTAVIADDSLVLIGGGGYGTTKFTDNSVGAFVVRAAGTFTDTSAPTYLTMLTTPVNAIVPIERVRIDASGNTGIGSTSPSALLSVMAGGTFASQALSTVFAISSSTRGIATSTLFSINSAGAITTSLGTGCVTSTSGLLSAGSACGTVTSIATNNGITGGTITTTGTIGLAALGSAGVLGAQTATVPTVQATSTLYGTGTPGQVLMWSGSGLIFAATSTASGGSVAGTNGQVQYNKFGSFGADGFFTIATTTNNTTLTIGQTSTSFDVGNIALSYAGGVSDGLITLTAQAGTSGNKTLTVPNVTGTICTTVSGCISTSLTKGNFIVGNDLGIAQATTTLFISSTGNIGVSSTTPWGLLSVNPNALGVNVPAFVVGSSSATNFIITNAGNTGVGTSTPGTFFSVQGVLNALASGFITFLGEIVGKDVANGWFGRISPTHGLVFSIATSTPTWTGTSTPGVDSSPNFGAPFAGTLQQIRCPFNTFLGVNVTINGTKVTPTYFIASSTVGVVKFTANNTFSLNDKILLTAGTTTSATASSGVVNGSCTIDVTETP